MQLVAFLEEEFDTEIDDTEVTAENFRTIADIERLVERAARPRLRPWRYLLHHLLSEAAERDPDHVAVRCRDRSLTYGELESASNGVAATLVARRRPASRPRRDPSAEERGDGGRRLRRAEGRRGVRAARPEGAEGPARLRSRPIARSRR